METLRLRIEFEDRVGIVFDVSQVVSPKNINIISLQVLPNQMYLETELCLRKKPGAVARA
ncbi:hypothetical protein N752_15015 [Desulforamulus aquiferis]|nr:hypothetical protein [Desulforamulus aquiferis]RYD04681.1 hypothetical protein N752_15015 [Desulforamulus aquiferis]